MSSKDNWIGHKVGVWGAMGRNSAWTNEALPGITIRHCQHPTAIYPYYLTGLNDGRTFHSLAEAKKQAENAFAEGR
jgi:hypothetical protein